MVIIWKRISVLAALGLVTISASGCNLLYGFSVVSVMMGRFWWMTPIIPVSPYYSQEIEATYHEEERYGKIPILDPVEGEHAPLFCLDPPTPDEVVRSLPDKAEGGIMFLAETHRNNLRMVIELIVDRLDECRFYPLVGPARMHHCHYKCTVYYDKSIRSDWPIPYSVDDEAMDVVYVDHDHLIRCAGPPTPR